MKFNRLIALSVVMLMMAMTASAQKNFFKEAEKYYSAGMIERAIDAYKKAYEKALPGQTGGKKATKLGTKGYISYQLGNSYNRFTEPAQAQQYYERAIKLKYNTENPEVYLKLAEVQKEQSMYDEAKRNFDKYYDASKDPKGKDGAESCKLSLQLMKEKTRYKVAEETILNTEDYDFSPLFINSKFTELFFTSDRKGATGEEENFRTGGQNKDVWYTKRDNKGHWSQPEILDNSINTPADEGAAVVDKKGKTIIFTRCIHDKKQSFGCDLWTADKKGKSWGTAEKLALRPEGWEDSTIAIGHPTLSQDNQILLFASDMPGGQGGLDIWMSKYDKREKKWLAPENLGPTINTKGNEMFPHLRDNGDLYIASDGHAGLGGLDNFKCKKINATSWEKPTNMGVPLNSNADDYGIIFEGKAERGLFTTNRKGKTRDDIWSFNLPPKIFKMTAYVFDKDTKEPIPDAEIKLIGSDNTLFTLTTDANGMVEYDKQPGGKFYVNEETNYNVEVGKTGEYLNGKQSFTTVGLTKSENFVYEFLLQSTKVEIRLPEIRYDYDKADLQVNDSVHSKDSLNYLYDLMIENPTIVVKLRSHTDCRGSAKYNRDLALRRAKACVDYLVDEKQIARERLIPVGMGEDEPLPNLGCDQIDKLPTKQEQEAAHQRNRRTDCKVESWDYVPSGSK